MKINSSMHTPVGITNEIASSANDNTADKATISLQLKGIQQSKPPAHPRKRELAQHLAGSTASSFSVEPQIKKVKRSEVKDLSSLTTPLATSNSALYRALHKVAKEAAATIIIKPNLSEKVGFPVNVIAKSKPVKEKTIKVVQLQRITIEDPLSAENSEYQVKNSVIKSDNSLLPPLKSQNELAAILAKKNSKKIILVKGSNLTHYLENIDSISTYISKIPTPNQ